MKRWFFSTEWTDSDKLLLCILMTHIFRDDYTLGRYGELGRPNVQTLHELVAMSPTELESHRSEIEIIADAYDNHRDIKKALAANAANA